jgi:hypothetical protein
VGTEHQEVSMSKDQVVGTLGEAPLGLLLAAAEEEVRQLGQRLSDRGVLAGDPVSADLLVMVRARLLVAGERVDSA